MSAVERAPRIELTIFRKSGGPLTKRIELGPDGRVRSDGSQCVMPRGVARRFTFYATSMQELAFAIDHFGSDEALATGALRPDLPDLVQVTTKRKLNGAGHPDLIARTQEFIGFRAGKPAIVLIDFDTKGMPPLVIARLEEFGGVGPALVAIIPALELTARIERPSTSAGLFDERSGEEFPGSGGRHYYPVLADGADSERFLKTLHEQCRPTAPRRGFLSAHPPIHVAVRAVSSPVYGFTGLTPHYQDREPRQQSEPG